MTYKIGESVYIANWHEHRIRAVGIVAGHTGPESKLGPRYKVQVRTLPPFAEESFMDFAESELTVVMSESLKAHDGTLTLMHLILAGVTRCPAEEVQFQLREAIAETTENLNEAELRQLVYLVADYHRGFSTPPF